MQYWNVGILGKNEFTNLASCFFRSQNSKIPLFQIRDDMSPLHCGSGFCSVLATPEQNPVPVDDGMRANGINLVLFASGLHDLLAGGHHLRSPQGKYIRGNGKTIFGRQLGYPKIHRQNGLVITGAHFDPAYRALYL